MPDRKKPDYFLEGLMMRRSDRSKEKYFQSQFTKTKSLFLAPRISMR
jgi:hypothetical protein